MIIFCPFSQTQSFFYSFITLFLKHIKHFLKYSACGCSNTYQLIGMVQSPLFTVACFLVGLVIFYGEVTPGDPQRYFEAQMQSLIWKSEHLGFHSSSHTDKLCAPSSHVTTLTTFFLIHKIDLVLPLLEPYQVILKIEMGCLICRKNLWKTQSCCYSIIAVWFCINNINWKCRVWSCYMKCLKIFSSFS